MSRCPVSDLHPDQCAHCRGDSPDVGEPTPRRYQPPAYGVRIWPPMHHVAPVPSSPPPPEEPTDDPRVKVARDLRAILRMTTLLDARSEDLAADPDMPGGLATVTAAPVASPATWERRVEVQEAAWFAALTAAYDERKHPGYGADEDDSWEPVLQTLLFWTEDWRTQLDAMPETWAPTIGSEARFLLNGDVSAWAWDNEPRWGDYAADVAAARMRMENVVLDGIRETRSRVVCDRCSAGRRLIRKWAKGNRPDLWKCPSCKAELTEDDLNRALARQLRSQGVEKWVERAEAVSALMVQGWTERQVLAMLAEEHDPVETHRMVTGRVVVWWPTLWRKHLLAAQDRDERARAKAAKARLRAACEARHGAECWHRGRCSA